MNKLFLVLALMFLTVSFNWRLCKNEMNDNYIPFFGNGSHFLGATTGVTSSIGGCALINQSDDSMKAFYVLNQNRIIEDIAKGRGEYLSTILDMMGCSKDEMNPVADILKDRFGSLVSKDMDLQYAVIEYQCESMC